PLNSSPYSSAQNAKESSSTARQSRRWYVTPAGCAMRFGTESPSCSSMRRRHSSARRALTGARGLGAAQAIVASGFGAEAIFRNPALIAHGPREVAFNIAQQTGGLVVADATGSVVWPVPRVGSFALTIRVLNEGEQPSVDDQQQVVGSFVPLAFIVAGTFAAQFGSRLEAGLTLKFLQLTSWCTGSCDLPPS